MTLPDDPVSAAPRGHMASHRWHNVPKLEGPASRRHERRLFARLALEARLARRSAPGARAFVQFAGFPRSGHSLIGALLDAHPEAAISHELDAMGLYAKGLPVRRLPSLAARYAERFRADGQWWNGLSYDVGAYDVADAPPPRAVRVAGDKKGDWATRWTASDETLWPRMRAEAEAASLRLPMILITRHPLDNVATMSLRRGRAYDRLRIETPKGGFGDALRAAQEAGEVPGAASDAMIDDYAALCAATLRLRRQTPEADWHEAAYEAVTRDAEAALSGLAAFLGLPDDAAWRRPAAALVRPSGQSRDRLRWTREQRARVDRIVRDYPFLHSYRDA